MSAAKPMRTLLSVVMDLLIIVAVVLVLRILVEFFGALTAQPWSDGFLRLTNALVLPLDLPDHTNEYGGFFDMDATVTILGTLLLEWVTGITRRSV